MTISPESFIDYQPTVGTIVEAGGEKFLFYNVDPLTMAAQGYKKALLKEFGPAPAAGTEEIATEDESILELF